MYPVPVAHAAVCGAKDKLENVPRMWEYVPNCVKGPGKCGRSLSDMFGGMSKIVGWRVGKMVTKTTLWVEVVDNFLKASLINKCTRH